MGVRLSELEAGDEIILQISSDNKQITMEAVINRSIRDDASLVELKSDIKEKLNFNNVQVAIEYYPPEQTPIRWKAAKVAYYSGQDYVIQVIGDGMRHNRRQAFRVGISKVGRMRRSGEKDEQVMIRDISATGFAITDQKKKFKLNEGDEATIFLEDMGYQLGFRGRVVRIVEEEDRLIYGFVIVNMCQDLEKYLADKQRRNKNEGTSSRGRNMKG